MSAGGSIVDRVEALLRDAGVPLQREAICDMADWVEDPQQVSRALWTLKSSGRVVRTLEGWTTTDAGTTNDEDAASPPAAAGPGESGQPVAQPGATRTPTRKTRAKPRRAKGASGRHPGGQHCWDFIAASGLGFFEGSIVECIVRWRTNGGLEDLEKARRCLERLIELVSQERAS